MHLRVTSFPLADANGNCVSFIDEAGNVQAHYTYDAFGNTVSQAGAMADDFPFRFSSKYLDDETGLYYYGYRYLSPALGRWVSRDPIGERGGLLLYGFVENRGLMLTDNFGLSIFPSICALILEQFKENFSALGTDYKSMIDIMNKKKCPLPTIVCKCCDDSRMEGSFSKAGSVITICENSKWERLKGNFRDFSDVGETLKHEFIHAFDACQNKQGGCDLEGMKLTACTEIRAYKFANGIVDREKLMIAARRSVLSSCKKPLDLADYKSAYQASFYNLAEAAVVSVIDKCMKLGITDPYPDDILETK